MAVAEGRNGKITVQANSTKHTVAEMGNWSVGGINRNMIDYTAFGDTVMKFKPGMLDPGTITFSGFYDGTDSTGQVSLIEAMSSGVAISNTTGRIHSLRLWANSDTDFDSYGFWSCVDSSGELYVTSMDLGQDKNGLGTVSFSLKVSKGALAWSTST